MRELAPNAILARARLLPPSTHLRLVQNNLTIIRTRAPKLILALPQRAPPPRELQDVLRDPRFLTRLVLQSSDLLLPQPKQD